MSINKINNCQISKNLTEDSVPKQNHVRQQNNNKNQVEVFGGAKASAFVRDNNPKFEKTLAYWKGQTGPDNLNNK